MPKSDVMVIIGQFDRLEEVDLSKSDIYLLAAVLKGSGHFLIKTSVLKFNYLQGMATITPSDFSDVGCYRVFLARFLVIFRVLGVIAGHWRAQIFNSWVL